VSTTDTPKTAPAVSKAHPEFDLKPSRLFTIVAILAFVVGGAGILGGLGGITYTYQAAAVENITTPGDAAIAEAPVRGPLTMWAQSDIITQHQLDRTDGQRYAEMDREHPDRMSWIDATALTTVLGLGIISYAFSAFAIAVGAVLVGVGLVVLKLRRSVGALH
jgi:hypothetical protein